jgi:hypothetical protein
VRVPRAGAERQWEAPADAHRPKQAGSAGRGAAREPSLHSNDRRRSSSRPRRPSPCPAAPWARQRAWAQPRVRAQLRRKVAAAEQPTCARWAAAAERTRGSARAQQRAPSEAETPGPSSQRVRVAVQRPSTAAAAEQLCSCSTAAEQRAAEQQQPGTTAAEQLQEWLAEERRPSTVAEAEEPCSPTAEAAEGHRAGSSAEPRGQAEFSYPQKMGQRTLRVLRKRPDQSPCHSWVGHSPEGSRSFCRAAPRSIKKGQSNLWPPRGPGQIRHSDQVRIGCHYPACEPR